MQPRGAPLRAQLRAGSKQAWGRPVLWSPAALVLAICASSLPACAASAAATPSGAKGLLLRKGLRLSSQTGGGRSTATLGALRAVVRRSQAEEEQAHLRGVRDGAGPGVYEDEGDDELDRNSWLGASRALDFNPLDDLEPVAPMDSVSPPARVSALSPWPLPGEHHDSMYIPPYLKPDMFPSVAGPTCMCEVPPREKLTDRQKEYIKREAKKLRIKRSEVRVPWTTNTAIKCNCSAEEGSPKVHRWFKWEALVNSSNFTLSPADPTYNAGDYWHPKPQGGLAAPEDRMALEHYPLQARGDHVQNAAAVAQEDRIASRFARYIDQLDARERGCEGDAVSERCVTECKPGDEVRVTLGSTTFNATVVENRVGGAVIIEFVPAAARKAAESVPCPLEASCGVFRTCLRPGSHCVERRAERSRDYLGNLRMRMKCPEGTQVCSVVQQVVGGNFVHKDGKACKAKGPKKRPSEGAQEG